jgi:serralysin
MPSIALNGVSSFVLGGVTYNWGGGYIGHVDYGIDPGIALNLSLIGSSWTIHSVHIAGSSNQGAVISDSASGSDRHIDHLFLAHLGGSSFNLQKTHVQTFWGGDGSDLVTFGQWSQAIHTNNGNDVVTTGAGGAQYIHAGHGSDTVRTGTGLVDVVETDAGIDNVVIGAGGVEMVRTGPDNDTVTTTSGWAASIRTQTGNDVLRLGSGGAGTVFLGDGNDTVVVSKLVNPESPVTQIIGESGVDTISFAAFTQNLNISLAPATSLVDSATGSFLLTGFENLTGGSGNDVLTGSGAANVLNGGPGNDTLVGGAGIDTLVGGAGGDFFVLNAPLAAANRDVVADFANAAGNNDTFRLENAVMTRLGAAGVLSANRFFAGAAAHDLDDRIVYNKTTGALFYDSNGSIAGGVTHLATLTNKVALTAADFVVI